MDRSHPSSSSSSTFFFFSCFELLVSRLYSPSFFFYIPEFKVVIYLAISSSLLSLFLRVEQISSSFHSLPPSLSMSLLLFYSLILSLSLRFARSQSLFSLLQTSSVSRVSSTYKRRSIEHIHEHTYRRTKMQQHQHYQYIDRRRPPRLIDNSNKTRNDDFYAKLERIRLSAAAASSSKLHVQN